MDQENSLIGAAMIVIRPFIEELDGNWKIVKGISIASLMVTIVMWISAGLVIPPQNEKAVFILNATGWLALVMFLFSYGSLYYEIFLQEQEKKTENQKKIQGFTDVEKR